MIHQTNLMVRTFLNLPFVFCIAFFLQCLYGYFKHSPNRFLEFIKLAKIMETNKILSNIKTKWISMISFIKCVLSKYHPLLMKMTLNAPTIRYVGSNLSLIINMETLLGLNVMVPLLEEIHYLIKFAQLKDGFVCIFISIVRICEGNVYYMYYNT